MLFSLCFPFLSTKTVRLGLILSYNDSLKIIRVSQLWTNPARYKYVTAWCIESWGAGHGMALYKTDDFRHLRQSVGEYYTPSSPAMMQETMFSTTSYENIALSEFQRVRIYNEIVLMFGKQGIVHGEYN